MTNRHTFKRILPAPASGLLLAAILVATAACADTDPQGRVLTPDDAGTMSDAGSLDASSDDGGDAASANNVSVADMGNDADGTDSGNNGGPCTANFDGVITRDEVILRAGLSGTFKVATDAPVDLEGEMAEGERFWSFDQNLPGDQLELIELRDPDQFWFSQDFPRATYVAKLSAREDLLGIFQATDDALLLLGVASPEDGLFETNLDYDPPVEILQFPIELDKTWAGEHDVSGIAQGAIVVYDEDYFSEVWATGTLDTPFGSFDVNVIRVELTRTIGFVETTIRTYAFVSECFGTVATVTSQDDEDEIFFTEAAEIRRLAP